MKRFSCVLMALCLGVISSGCETLADNPEQVRILIEETEKAVMAYLAAKDKLQTPEQIAAVTVARIALRLLISKLQDSGYRAEAERLGEKAGLTPSPLEQSELIQDPLCICV